MHIIFTNISIIFSLVFTLFAFFYTHEINKTNINLNLFDKRVKVYYAALYLLHVIAHHPKEGFNMGNPEIVRRTDESIDIMESSRFLFNDDKDIEKFLLELRAAFSTFLSKQDYNDSDRFQEFYPHVLLDFSNKLGLFNKYLKIDDISSIDKICNKFKNIKSKYFSCRSSNINQSEQQ